MRHSLVKISLLLLCCFVAESPAQSQSVNMLLQKVYQKIQKAKDYSVKAHIRIDMPFIKMLPTNARIYYKQKDKFKVEAKGIAIIPRQGFDQMGKIISDSSRYTCIEQGSEMLSDTRVSVINVISLSDTSDLILGKLWIDPKQALILKSQLSTRSNGTILSEYKYGSQSAFGLPDFMTFTVDVKKFKIPKVMGADINSSGGEENKQEEGKKKEGRKGKVFITLTEYAVNKGIPDDFFKDKK
jgi:hypothetical protein